MSLLMLKNLPRFEKLLEAAKKYPDLEPTSCEAFLHLLQAGDELFRVMHSLFSEHSISQGRFIVLLLLLSKEPGGCCGPHTPAELADKASVTRATMTGLIDTLERDGMVRREPDSTDRRMMLVKITEKGETFMRGLLPAHFRRIAELMSTLTEEERKTLVRLLDKVVARASVYRSSPGTELLETCPATLPPS